MEEVGNSATYSQSVLFPLFYFLFLLGFLVVPVLEIFLLSFAVDYSKPFSTIHTFEAESK